MYIDLIDKIVISENCVRMFGKKIIMYIYYKSKFKFELCYVFEVQKKYERMYVCLCIIVNMKKCWYKIFIDYCFCKKKLSYIYVGYN